MWLTTAHFLLCGLPMWVRTSQRGCLEPSAEQRPKPKSILSFGALHSESPGQWANWIPKSFPNVLLTSTSFPPYTTQVFLFLNQGQGCILPPNQCFGSSFQPTAIWNLCLRAFPLSPNLWQLINVTLVFSSKYLIKINRTLLKLQF